MQIYNETEVGSLDKIPVVTEKKAYAIGELAGRGNIHANDSSQSSVMTSGVKMIIKKHQ